MKVTFNSVLQTTNGKIQENALISGVNEPMKGKRRLSLSHFPEFGIVFFLHIHLPV